MSGTYAFSVDRQRDLLTITFAGFFRPEDLAGYGDAKRAAMAALRCAANRHVTLCDFTACAAQSQATLSLFQSSLDDPVTRSRRLAVVVSSALAAMQVQRIVTRRDAAVFQSVDDALAWLAEPERPDEATTTSPVRVGEAG